MKMKNKLLNWGIAVASALLFAQSVCAGTPFYGTPSAIPGRIEAEDFDYGAGSYSSRASQLEGNDYRDAEDVSIYTTSDSFGVETRWVSCVFGSWYEYTVNVEKSGVYDLNVYHTGYKGCLLEGSYNVLMDGKSILKWSAKDSTEKNLKGEGFVCSGLVELKAGIHVLKFYASGTPWQIEIDRFEFVENPTEAYKRRPFHGTPIAIPGRVEAEDFDIGAEYITYRCKSTAQNNYRTEKVKIDTFPNGEKALSLTETDWYSYTVDVKKSGLYALKAHLASSYYFLFSYLELDGRDIGKFEYGYGGEITPQNVYLGKGVHILTLVGDPSLNMSSFSGRERIDAIEFTLVDSLECKLTLEADRVDRISETNAIDVSLTVKDLHNRFNYLPNEKKGTERVPNEKKAVVRDTLPLGFDVCISGVSDPSSSSCTYKPAPQGATFAGVIEWTLTKQPENGENTLTYSVSPVWKDEETSKVWRSSIMLVTHFDTIAEVTSSLVKKPGRSNYNGAKLQIPGRIEAEHFDAGGQNFSYFDNDRGNSCENPFRADDWVETKKDSGGLVIAGEGEWLEYTVNVEVEDYYFWYLRCPNMASGFFSMSLDGVTIVPQSFISNAGFSSSDTVFGTTSKLTEGTHVLRISFGQNSNGAAVDWVEFKRLGKSASPFHGQPLAIPGRIEAEDFDKGGAGIGYYSSLAKGDNSGYRHEKVDVYKSQSKNELYGYAGDWYQYTVDVEKSGMYSVHVVNNQLDYSHFLLELDGKVIFDSHEKTDSLEGGSPRVELRKGKKKLRLVVEGADTIGSAFDFIDFEPIKTATGVGNALSAPAGFPLTANVFALDGRFMGKVRVASASTLLMMETLKEAGFRRGTYVLKADGFSKLVICK